MSCEAPSAAAVNCTTVLAQALGWSTSASGGVGDPSTAPRFGSSSTALEVTEGLDLSGRVYIVTGATGVLGSEVCRVLCMRGAHVVAAVRSTSKGAALVEDIRSSNEEAHITVMGCDLASLEAVRGFTAAFCARATPLHGIVCCAGVIMQPYELSRDGHEMHFAVNHLGHFLLVNQLVGELIRTAASSGIQGRIVNAASNMHHFTYRVKRGTAKPSRGIDFVNLDEERGYNATNAYAQSKLANILHAWSLNERLREVGANVAAFAVHPGLIGAELKNVLDFPGGGLLFSFARGRRTKTPEQAAATMVFCAARVGVADLPTAPSAVDQGACYYADCHPRRSSLPARDPRLARNLWDESEKLVGLQPGTAAPVTARAGGTDRLAGHGSGGVGGMGMGTMGTGGGVGGERSPRAGVRGGSPFVARAAGAGGVAPGGSPRTSYHAIVPPASPSAGGGMDRGGELTGTEMAVPGSPPSVGGGALGGTGGKTPGGTPLKVTPSKSGKWGLGSTTD